MHAGVDEADEDDAEVTRLAVPRSALGAGGRGNGDAEERRTAPEDRGTDAGVGAAGSEAEVERLAEIRSLWVKMGALVGSEQDIVGWEAETAGSRAKEAARVEERMAKDWEAIHTFVRQRSATPPIENALVLDRRKADLDALQRDPEAFTVRITPIPETMHSPGRVQKEDEDEDDEDALGGRRSQESCEVGEKRPAPSPEDAHMPVSAGDIEALPAPETTTSTPSPVSVMEGAREPKRAKVRVLINAGKRIATNFLPEPEVAPRLVLRSPGVRLAALPPTTFDQVTGVLPTWGTFDATNDTLPGATAGSCGGHEGHMAALWKKYGEKRIWSKAVRERVDEAVGPRESSLMIKSYFRCRDLGCDARMYEEATVAAPHVVISRYFKGAHNHELAGEGDGEVRESVAW